MRSCQELPQRPAEPIPGGSKDGHGAILMVDQKWWSYFCDNLVKKKLKQKSCCTGVIWVR